MRSEAEDSESWEEDRTHGATHISSPRQRGWRRRQDSHSIIIMFTGTNCLLCSHAVSEVPQPPRSLHGAWAELALVNENFHLDQMMLRRWSELSPSSLAVSSVWFTVNIILSYLYIIAWLLYHFFKWFYYFAGKLYGLIYLINSIVFTFLFYR